MEPDGTYPMPKDGWVCFHCGERFKKYGTARDHFGETPGKLLQCRALRADLEEVATSARLYIRVSTPWSTGPDSSYAALEKALALPGVRKVLEKKEDVHE